MSAFVLGSLGFPNLQSRISFVEAPLFDELLQEAPGVQHIQGVAMLLA